MLVAIGSIIGANTRFLIFKKLERINFKKDFIILLINTFSSFFIGLYFSIISHISNLKHSYQLGLFVVIGFLGGFSTFSTFIYDLFELVMTSKFNRAFKLLIISLTLAILACAFGFFIGNQ